LLKGNQKKPNYIGVPTVVFAIPSLASVGLSEREAGERGLKYRDKREMTSTWYSSRRVGEKYSGYKVLVEEGTDRILGAHLLGDQASEIINLFAVAIRHRPETHGVFLSHSRVGCTVHVVVFPNRETPKVPTLSSLSL
jgi:glutathione reductase (NADPH)